MNPQVSGNQLTLDFTPGLTERFPSALECLKASAYSNNKQREALAALAGLAPQLQALLKAAGVPQ